MSIGELIQDMISTKDLRAIPTADEPALRLDDPVKRDAIEKAHQTIRPMFWGKRIELDDACKIIRDWLAAL